MPDAEEAEDPEPNVNLLPPIIAGIAAAADAVDDDVEEDLYGSVASGSSLPTRGFPPTPPTPTPPMEGRDRFISFILSIIVDVIPAVETIFGAAVAEVVDEVVADAVADSV